eukprot:244405-Hanusia_phi.AAC.1
MGHDGTVTADRVEETTRGQLNSLHVAHHLPGACRCRDALMIRSFDVNTQKSSQNRTCPLASTWCFCVYVLKD